MWSPQDWNLWKLDIFLVRLGIVCGACGSFKWDRPCFSEHHWFRKEPNM